AGRDIRGPAGGERGEVEGVIARVEVSVAGQLVACEVPEPALGEGQVVDALGQIDLQSLVDLNVEVFEEFLAGVGHARGDLLFQLAAQDAEGVINRVAGATALVDGGDALLEVDVPGQGAENFVGGAEDALEQVELFG